MLAPWVTFSDDTRASSRVRRELRRNRPIVFGAVVHRRDVGREAVPKRRGLRVTSPPPPIAAQREYDVPSLDPVVIALVVFVSALTLPLIVAVRRRRLQKRRAREEEQVREALARVARDVQWDRSLRRLGAGKVETREEESTTGRR